ncbi:coatomer subunit beta [Achroia grisella]|uniref:coatomer subunit beta n=1 Tax=Achroia grisella TaxID=688607 RepID=UPI0027D2C188|nr:coatomer subunit beta [Achroia grisella]
MASVEQPCYTLINFPTDTEPHNEMQLKLDLEKGDTKKKIEALKKTIGIILSGEKIPGLLMIIIRFVLPLQDHTIKKLLLIFWEIVPKTTPDGKLMQEMILVCDAYRKDLQHPNEFIRGSTLRFLCKLKEPELLEPLMPAIRACLEHRHSYVRRNAVLAIFTIYRNFEFLIPDAPELVAKFLEGEQDMSCKRNAFLMLLHADQERALSYLASRLDNVHGFGDILQLVIVELIYKVCHANPSERSRFIRTVYGLLNSTSPAVRYEAAGTLVTLSSAPAALKAAAACYIDLIVKESDNNVKLIVVGRLAALRDEGGEAAARALPDLAMDVLRVLAAPDLDVRRHTLALALEVVGPRHAEELVGVLRKEAARAASADHDHAATYRQLLVRALHKAAVKFPEVAGSVAPALLEMVGDGSEPAAADVLQFLRVALHNFDHLRDLVYQKLLETLPSIRVGKVVRSALWLLAEFADNNERALAALDVLDAVIPPSASTTKEQEEEVTQPKPELAPRQLITSDGTYATQSAFNLPTAAAGEAGAAALGAALRAGDSFTAACACSALARLALKLPVRHANRALAASATLLAYHKTHGTGAGAGTPGAAGMTADDTEHGARCVQSASSAPPPVRAALLTTPRAALAALLHAPPAARCRPPPVRAALLTTPRAALAALLHAPPAARCRPPPVRAALLTTPRAALAALLHAPPAARCRPPPVRAALLTTPRAALAALLHAPPAARCRPPPVRAALLTTPRAALAALLHAPPAARCRPPPVRAALLTTPRAALAALLHAPPAARCRPPPVRAALLTTPRAALAALLHAPPAARCRPPPVRAALLTTPRAALAALLHAPPAARCRPPPVRAALLTTPRAALAALLHAPPAARCRPPPVRAALLTTPRAALAALLHAPPAARCRPPPVRAALLTTPRAALAALLHAPPAARCRPPPVRAALLTTPRAALAALLHAPPAARCRPPPVRAALLTTPRAALAALLHAPPAARETARATHSVSVETGVQFAALAGAGAAAAAHDMFDLSLSKALQGRSTGSEERGKLSKVTQLTGFSDPVYAEAIVSVNQYDIVLDVLIVNQTDDTLVNCTVELATLGDLRLVERPASVVLGPRDFTSIKAHVKVASTENAIIFGNIVYEVSGASMDRGVVVLNDIHVDIVDYIQPADCSDADFRQMWAEFEWENKVAVNTNITDLREYLDHLLSSTNMKCLTPNKALSGQCGFMAANLYARSIFGEDALANLSIETPLHRANAPVVGHVRIRAKTQGMALSLGDKINTMQKAPPQKPPTLTPAA